MTFKDSNIHTNGTFYDIGTTYVSILYIFEFIPDFVLNIDSNRTLAANRLTTAGLGHGTRIPISGLNINDENPCRSRTSLLRTGPHAGDK